MDRRSTKSLWRDYAIPMQDPQAFSLNYNKDTSRDPRKGLLKKKSKTKKVDYTDHTGMLKIDQPPVKKQGGGKVDAISGASTTDPEFFFSTKFNTELTPTEYKEFNKWATTPSEDGRKHINDIGAYDVQGYWKEFVSQGVNPNDKDDHGPDKYKKPNHPTFSNESMYSSKGFPGGTWGEDGTYTPSEHTKKLYSREYYARMFGREPNRPEHLSKYRDGGIIPPKTNKKEMKFRKTFSSFPGLMKKGGKVGDPKDRKKPGGSNVGKYSKSEGPFAGPSGGAPKGSYPIGSKSRGKSALKLAHNAPNPSGIKSAVYRNYPDLKPKKAMEGAKLGIGGMGQLQHKAASGPGKYKQPVDKVKRNTGLYKKEARKFNRPPLPH